MRVRIVDDAHFWHMCDLIHGTASPLHPFAEDSPCAASSASRPSCSLLAGRAPAAEEARLLRFPAIHGDTVVFTYAGDLYTVAGRRRHRPPADQPRRLRDVRPLLARRQAARLHRPVRRQHRGLRHARRGRRARAGSPTPPRSAATTSPTAWGRTTSSWAGSTTASTSSSARACARSTTSSASSTLVAVEGGLPRAAAAAARRLLLLLARRQEAGLQPRLPRVPHLETLPRRHGRRHLDLRFQDEEDREHHQQRRPGHHPDVAAATGSISSPTATTTSG